MAQLIIIVAMFALLWLFIIRPQRQRAQMHRELQTRVNVGDEILTVGGLYGNIRAIAAVIPPEGTTAVLEEGKSVERDEEVRS